MVILRGQVNILRNEEVFDFEQSLNKELPIWLLAYFVTAVSTLTSESASLASLSSSCIVKSRADLVFRIEEADLGANNSFSGEMVARDFGDDRAPLCTLCAAAKNLFTSMDEEPRRNKKNLKAKT